jgi:hypothetical protein
MSILAPLPSLVFLAADPAPLAVPWLRSLIAVVFVMAGVSGMALMVWRSSGFSLSLLARLVEFVGTGFAFAASSMPGYSHDTRWAVGGLGGILVVLALVMRVCFRDQGGDKDAGPPVSDANFGKPSSSPPAPQASAKKAIRPSTPPGTRRSDLFASHSKLKTQNSKLK